MRYKLIVQEHNAAEEHEVGGHRKSTKAEINHWIDDNIDACGLDWRVGYSIKFRTSDHIYTWKWIKDNTPVKS